MKNYMKSTIALVVLMLSAASTWAQGTFDTTITLDGARPTVAPGTVEPQIANGVATLTVTASDGYYIEASDITVIKTIDGQHAQGRHRAGGNNIADPITLTPSGTVNPTGETVYTFTVTNEKYDYEVTADFHALQDISTATVTLSQTSFTYDGSAKEPGVSSVVLGTTTIASDSYNVSYENNVNAADATAAAPPTVRVTATKIPYTGEAVATFTIAAATLTVTSEGWIGVYDGEEHSISLEGVPDYAKVRYGHGSTVYTTNTSPSFKDAGKYVIYYKVSMPNYATVEDCDSVVIEKAPVTLNLKGLGNEMRLNKGDELSFNVETEPEGLPVISSSSNEAVAIVEVLDEKGSTFRVISQGLGSARITATFEGNTNYKDASASFDVIVEGDAIQPITENQEYSFGNANDYLKPDGSENPLNGVVINNIIHNLRIDDATGYDSEEGCIAIGTPTSPENIRGAVEGFANFIADGMAPYDPNNPLYREYQAWLEASWSGMECLVEVPKEGQIGVFTVESKEEGACQIAVQPGVGETQTFQHVERSEDGVIITPEDGRMWQDRLDAMGCGDVWRKLYGGKPSTGTENLVMLFGIFNRFIGGDARSKAIHKGKKSGINVKVYSVTYKVKSTSGIESIGRETKILSADGWYDLYGQRISQPQQKGIYINNGRKVVIK